MKNNEERFHTQKFEKQKYSKLINYMGIKPKKKKKKKKNKKYKTLTQSQWPLIE
jgi:hypothetical protein